VSRFSQRLPPHADTNAISAAIAAVAADGAFVDLTESNPTRVGFDYPSGLLAGLGGQAGLTYEPAPLGLPEARAAVAADARRRGVHVDPAHVVLSASSSESYAWLFKLLCDPGDAVLVPRPSYPLFEHLTRLEAVRAVPYDLEYHRRWQIDFSSIVAAPAATRAVLVVSPNNPTGSYLDLVELERLVAICRERDWALIADEVFADYPLDATSPVTDVAARAGVLAFSLGGASKALGLPQVKLGWMVAGGPPAQRDAALAALELIADTYLSVSTPVQQAAAGLLRGGAAIRGQIQSRIAHNLARARTLADAHQACELLRVEGGWSAVIRVPAIRSEEALVLDLLRRERILVHPGFFFDFRHEAFIVVSLLPRPDMFEDALGRVLRHSVT
jgi:aspartate/methionine/tyrosine aminotransferase